MGITVTTFPTVPTSSNRVKVFGGKVESNGYNDIDAEAVNDVWIDNLTTVTGIVFSSSTNTHISNVVVTDGGLYGTTTDDVIIQNVDIRKTDTTSAVYVSGVNPRVSNVKVQALAGGSTGNAVVVAASGSRGSLTDVFVDGCTNGIVATVEQGSNWRVVNASNVAIKASHQTYEGRPQILHSLAEGVLVGAGSIVPATGGWARGDIIYSTVPSAAGTIGWVCVASGTPGTWKTFGTISA